jgi:hypothetical protein
MMTETEFDARLAAAKEKGFAVRDHVVAHLLREALGDKDEKGREWTQRRIAERSGKSQKWVDTCLRFGRFLSWLSTNGTQPAFPVENLTERRFRTAWGKTEGKGRSDNDRFTLCVPLIEKSFLVRPPAPNATGNARNGPSLRQAIIDLCKDGQRRTSKQIATALEERIPGIGREQVRKAFHELEKNPPKGRSVDVQHIGRTARYRITKKSCGPPVDPEEAGATVTQVIPVLEEIRRECRKTTAALSISLILECVDVIEKRLSSLLVAAEVA